MIRLICIKLLLFMALTASLAGCGSSGESDTSPAPESDWDSFIWDQDNWE